MSSEPSETAQLPCADIGPRAFYLGLALVTAVGLVTRLLYLGSVYVWIDETPILAEPLWQATHGGLVGWLRGMKALSFDVYAQQTYNGTWAALVYAVCGLAGSAGLWWARLPSALAGVAALPVLALLTVRVSGSRVAGLAAAVLAATSIVQTHYAQQVLPYGPAVLAAALVVWAAVAWNAGGPDAGPCWAPAGFALFAAVAAAALLHNCGLPVAVAALALLAAGVLWSWSRRHIGPGDAARQAAALAQSGLVLALCVLVFMLPKAGTGLRGYLLPYYAPARAGAGLVPGALGTARFALTRICDLATYALNAAYDDRLYRPLALNPAAIPGVLLALVGVVVLWRSGRAGRRALALGALSVLVVLVGALARRYPFGGVRQCLPLSVFVYVLAGAGFWAAYRRFRAAALALAVAWVVLWAAELPRFYEQRLSPYDAETLTAYAELSGTRLFVAVDDRGWPEHAVLRYHLRDRRDLRVLSLPEAADGLRQAREPFVLVSFSKSLGCLEDLSKQPGAAASEARAALKGLLADGDLSLTPLVEVARNPVRPAAMQEDGQSIYTPLNGLFLYKIDWQGQVAWADGSGGDRGSRVHRSGRMKVAKTR